METLPPAVYRRYSEILREMRADGRVLSLLEMGLAADLAMAVVGPRRDPERAREIRERLELDGGEVAGGS